MSGKAKGAIVWAIVGILLALLLGFGIGYAVRSGQDTFFKRCLHAYGHDQASSDRERRGVERTCIHKEAPPRPSPSRTRSRTRRRRR